jgi:SAM-dependent methyltransferase
MNLTNDYQHQLYTAIINNPAFASATFSGTLHGQTNQWERVQIRPVLVKNVPHLQLSWFDVKRNITKNYEGDAAAQAIAEALALPFRNFHIVTQTERIQVNISKKGKPLLMRQSLDQPVAVDLAHDRAKHHPLPEGVNLPWLNRIGLTTGDGRVKSDMRRKFTQINEYLRLLDETGELTNFQQRPVRVVDFGCGNAYLTFATYYYLTEVLHIPAVITGVDIKADLVERHNANAQQLGWTGLHFEQGYIADYRTDQPVDIVVALHACDTATDDALAQGIRWNSKIIVCAPCCHHHLQAQLSERPIPAPFAPVLRYGLMHERIGDVLTDSFRALLLRMHSYHVDVVQFVPAEHTPKNLMIRAIKTRHVSAEATAEYDQLKAYWDVTPYLADALR